MFKKHYEDVAAVIIKNEKIYCCQRGPKGECALKWEFPGGKIEPGETHEEALIREIKEELNSIIKMHKYINTIAYEYATFFLTMHVYECELIQGNLEISEHIQFKWLSKNELNTLYFAEADKKVVSDIFS